MREANFHYGLLPLKCCLKNARGQWVFYGVCKLGYLYDSSLHFVCLENSHLLIQTTEQVWDKLENIPIKTPIFPHFLWYLHQGRSVKSMNRTVAFDYKPWQCLREKLHFRSYNVLHIHLISLWFPSICHSSKGPRTLYCRLSIVANHLREVPKGSHR